MVRWATSADNHNVPNECAEHVMANVAPETYSTAIGEDGLRRIGFDQTGRLIEVISIDLGEEELVIHVMPYNPQPRTRRTS